MGTHVAPVRSGRVSVGDESSYCVDEYCYLGDIISAGGEAEDSSAARLINEVARMSTVGEDRWYGHLERKTEKSWLKRCINMNDEEDRVRDRPRKTGGKIIREDRG